MMRFLLLALAFYGTWAAKPTIPTSYTAKVTMTMPYYDFVEPLTVWYDEDQGLGRIDYWEGVDKYIYNSSGESYQIVPISEDGTSSTQTCFKDGQGFDPVSVFPDLTYFPEEADDGDCTVNGVECMSWTYRSATYNDTTGFDGNYTYFVSKDSQTPLRFSFVGFNVILGSHFDEYIFDYLNVEEGSPDASVFAVPSNMECQILETDDDDSGGPTKGLMSRINIENPLAEIRGMMPGNKGRDHLIGRFEAFAHKHSRVFKDNNDRFNRMLIFANTERFVNAMNRKHLSYWLEVNFMGDWTESEKKALRGRQHTPKGTIVPATHTHELSGDDLPDEVDWRTKGAVTPVKDQGTCGSCWSQAAAQTMEGQVFLKTGELIELSPQNLMDCSWPQGNNACDGGLDYQGYAWMLEHGGKLATAASYPYLNADGYCRFDSSTVGDYFISGYANVTGGVDALNDALVNVGPLSVSIDATPPSFYFYAGGLYYNDECKSGLDDLDHSVLAVGYTTVDDQIYTYVKNSWSTHWGDAGYVMISQENNCCGVATQPTYVIMG